MDRDDDFDFDFGNDAMYPTPVRVVALRPPPQLLLTEPRPACTSAPSPPHYDAWSRYHHLGPVTDLKVGRCIHDFHCAACGAHDTIDSSD